MTAVERPDTLTPITAPEFADAFERAWRRLVGAAPSRATVLLATAHSGLETGWWKSCHNWNLGNAKSVPGDGRDWTFFPCGELLPRARALQLVAADPEHARLGRDDGGKNVEVLFVPPHPICRFRAFSSLDDAIADHLAMMKNNFGAAWPALVTGDTTAFVTKLKASGYFTAELEPYLTAVRGCVTRAATLLAAPPEDDVISKEVDPDEALLEPDERIVAIVRSFAGASLKTDRARLRDLVGRGVDEKAWAEQVVQWTTNCGTFALGVLARACLTVEQARKVHPLLATRSVNGKSISWLMEIGQSRGAWVPMHGRAMLPKRAWLMHYRSVPYRLNEKGDPIYDDHIDWCLSDPTPMGIAQHGGGGRAGNAISVETGDIRWSSGRPLYQALDISRLDIPPRVRLPTLDDELPLPSSAPYEPVPSEHPTPVDRPASVRPELDVAEFDPVEATQPSAPSLPALPLPKPTTVSARDILAALLGGGLVGLAAVSAQFC